MYIVRTLNVIKSHKNLCHSAGAKYPAFLQVASQRGYVKMQQNALRLTEQRFVGIFVDGFVKEHKATDDKVSKKQEASHLYRIPLISISVPTVKTKFTVYASKTLPKRPSMVHMMKKMIENKSAITLLVKNFQRPLD